MAGRKKESGKLTLQGLELAPAQVWNKIRLVPLLRRQPSQALRLGLRSYGDGLGVVFEEDRQYWSLIPHGLVLEWSGEGETVGALGSSVLRADGRGHTAGRVRLHHRMVKREAAIESERRALHPRESSSGVGARERTNAKRLRLLPLHLSMEGFLSLHFGGPDVAWSEYSSTALRHGLGLRYEQSISGQGIVGLEDALRLFELHAQQVGVLLFVGSVLASAFVLPHPDDYRALHGSLLRDFYSVDFYYHGLHGEAPDRGLRIDEEQLEDLEGLRAALHEMREQWAELHHFVASELFDVQLDFERRYRFAPFSLERFIGPLSLGEETHMGELIRRDDGQLEYLHSYRLSKAQTRRAWLLRQLSRHCWNLDATAVAVGSSREEFLRQLERAGFGYLLREGVLAKRRR